MRKAGILIEADKALFAEAGGRHANNKALDEDMMMFD
jgi:hypothetical protein